MKYIKVSIIPLIVGLVLLGCTNDTNVIPTDPGSVSTNIKKGEWRITYFWISDHEETDHFNGYSFAFNDDGSLIA
ncbi:MAG: hypothetical protein HKN92_06350, partial [Chitinophagales bacterium]|nr:hypothetical protein [Chitinophagales bacterium]